MHINQKLLILVTDEDTLNLDYITVIVSAGLSVLVITIAVSIVFVIRRICRATKRFVYNEYLINFRLHALKHVIEIRDDSQHSPFLKCHI